MTDEHDRSRLDTVIDDVVRDMMQREARGDLAARVLQSIAAPPQRVWFAGVPALAAAAAVIVLVAVAAMFMSRSVAVTIPSIEVVTGIPSGFESLPTTPLATNLPLPEISAPAPAAAATSESLFGPRRGQVTAASVRSLPKVRLAFVLSDGASGALAERDTVTMEVTQGEKRDARTGALSLTAMPELLSSGAVKVTISVQSPVQRQLTITLVPGASTQLLETVDPRTGRRMTIETTATVLAGNGSQR